MIKVAIIERIETESGLVYRLEDEKGNKASFNVIDLIKHIKSDKIQITNLIYQEDRYLIDEITKRDRICLSEIPIEEKERIRKILNKAEMLGFKIETLDTFCGHECYLIHQINDSAMLIIPSDVTNVNALHHRKVINTIKDLTGQLTVIGGENVEDATYLFRDCKASELNLSKFRPKELKIVKEMFKNCTTNKINIEHINISKSADRETMFSDYTKDIQMSLSEKQEQINMLCNKIFKIHKEELEVKVKVIDNNESLLEINEIERVVTTNKMLVQLSKIASGG